MKPPPNAERASRRDPPVYPAFPRPPINPTIPLQAAATILKGTPHRHRHLWLLSESDPDDEAATRREISLLRPQLRSPCALGLGPETESLAKLVPGALTNLSASQLPVLATRLFSKHALDA